MKVLITNQELFNGTDVELNLIQSFNGTLRGDVTINGITHTGEHGKYYYEDEFGFVIED
jgi:hypothetical protein